MKAVRALPALLAASVGATVLAHPGHDAPPVHAHDTGEALVMAAVILGIAVAGAAAWFVRRKRNKDR